MEKAPIGTPESEKFSYEDLERKLHQLEEENTNLKRENAELRHLANVDKLTTLLNRRGFEEEIDTFLKALENQSGVEGDRAVEQLGKGAVVAGDIDFFKSINDTYSHESGDQVLQEVAKILKGAVRDVDVVARFGGEEFIIFCPNTDERGAVLLAERIKTLLERTQITLENIDEPITITMSFGVAEIDNIDREKIGEALFDADRALYAAKAEDRNRVRTKTDLGDDLPETE